MINPMKPGMANVNGRRAWLAGVCGLILAYAAGAWAYYGQLLGNPFFGAPLAPVGLQPAALTAAYGSLGITAEQYALATLARQTVVSLVWLALGGLIAWRTRERSALNIAFLAALNGLLTGNNTAALRAWGAGWVLPGNLLNVVATMAVFTLLLIFPDGRFRPRSAFLVWLANISLTLVITWTPRALGGATGGLIVLSALSLMALPLYRYARLASPIERQQVKWVMLGVFFQAPLWAAGAFALPAMFKAATQTLANALAYNFVRQTINDIGSLTVPAAIGLAMLRYRLWDVDLLIRRTLAYSALTGLLVVVYFGLVTFLQSLFTAITGQQSYAALVLSTLLIAGLFNPFRRRIQDLIDLRFYRQKYDAGQALAEFAAAARSETEIEPLTGRLVRVVQETIQPQHMALWLKPNPMGRRPEHDQRGDA